MGSACGNGKDKLKADKDLGWLPAGGQISVNRKFSVPPAAHLVRLLGGSSSLKSLMLSACLVIGEKQSYLWEKL